MNTAFVHSIHPAATVAIELGYVTSEISVTDFILGRITQGSPITDPLNHHGIHLKSSHL